ncbi:hypothetical protein [Vibrio paracholerae]|uniref:hypothetical protein n=1 Tax=Vibrio paracholerae TaxID=650003 RepID=UPI0020949C6E|nr:hypothetical protein [Vibrio paracholerae]EGQ8491867.1 hypothetical protein [Vibrio cholerae]MCO7020886.1 hypothetical protein [Vibrio paracholerae]
MSKKEYKLIGGPMDGQSISVIDGMDYLEFIIENDHRSLGGGFPERIEVCERVSYRKTRNTLGDFVYVFLE